jgi:hypothetical protein
MKLKVDGVLWTLVEIDRHKGHPRAFRFIGEGQEVKRVGGMIRFEMMVLEALEQSLHEVPVPDSRLSSVILDVLVMG